MRILVVGASGTIGRAVVEALSPRHDIVAVSRSTQPLRVDIADPDSIRAMYRAVGAVDAVVSTSGQAKFMPLAQLGDEDFAFSLRNSNAVAHSGHYRVFYERRGGGSPFLSVIATYLSEEGLQRLCGFIQIIDWTASNGATRLQIQLTPAASPVLQAVSFENY